MNALGYILAGAAGFAAGAGVVYFAVYKPEKSMHEEELRDQAEYYHSKYEKKLSSIENRQEEIKEQGEMIRETQEKLEKLRTPYSTYSDFDSKEAYLASLQGPKEDPNVYDIDGREFVNGGITYEKVSLRVYEGDGTVTNCDGDTEEPVVGSDLIGVENLNRLIDGDETELYLRDDEHMVDYEIDKVEGTYVE